MDTYSSSGEKLNIKTRKPYTITKQRERWTEEEHNSFLEALKLYGRAWQRIEEHIGTKTAVQIRSHAQKFFTKLEKEAVAKGVPTRQALDMEIPPPRPKRKPNYPYPRKTGSGTCPKTHHPNPNPNPKEEEDNATHHHHRHHHQPTLVSSLPSGIDHLHLPEYHEQKQEEIANTSEQVDVDVEKEEPPCASLSSENDNSIPRGVFRDFINLDETNESYITTIETRKYQKKSDQDGMHTSSLFDFPEGQNHHDNANTNGVHSYPRHVPVQVVDGNQGNIPTGTEEMSTLEEKLEQVHNNPNPNLSVNNNNIASRCCSSYETIPPFHPPVFTHPFSDNHNNEEENYRSFLHVSSTISSLIVSSLLQNPAAHAAASFAAKFWHPPGNTEASSGDDSETQTPSTPSMTSIAAATVAAATAWWAAHGLLPVCPPFYPTPAPTPFSFGAPPPPPVTVEDGNQAREKAPPEKIADSSSEEEEEEEEDSEGKLNTGSNPDDDIDTTKGTGTGTVVEETNVNVRKQVDRSSCGSNTTSSSEIETDALEKKSIKEQEETAAVATAAASDVPDLDSISRTSIIRGGRSTINPNESWKEVSEEGRLAFQALFSRQVLPQSFSDRHNNNNNNNNNGGGGELDLNRMMLRGEKNMEEGLLTIGLGNVKLNVNNTHTGFKPYKRCSMEAKEKPGSSSNQNDDKAAKRMRFQAEGST